ncbi:acetylpolyamine aminohydrolase [Sorangium cellulosum]|uniref:Acetylpolyamine aminohydrolase n=1 Tax=Sorangium cellulosum TaxID=56 RepID=A0A2L0ESU0_SORCE|nr:acetylpolyamine aminohydrolase [Sorangium cellulosum]
MFTVYSEEHALHAGGAELSAGVLVPCYDAPSRAEMILARVRSAGLGPVVAPEDHGRGPIERVHSPRFLEFLSTAWEQWQACGYHEAALPSIWPGRHLRAVEPDNIAGKLGYYCFDASTPLVAGSFRAAYAAAQVALSAAARLASQGARRERAAFALCRPPGHHAASDLYGGYCFLNNAAIAAQALRDVGAARVAVLDVDYHHGNGTQAIFYDRPDVLFLSLHGDPRTEFPFFLGHADERGAGEGDGYNVNYPLPRGSGFGAWSEALEDACRRIERYAPDALVISLGVDSYKDDPICSFRLESADFTTYGRRIAQLRRPTLFVMEGGYAVEQIGINAVNVLQGFEEA